MQTNTTGQVTAVAETVLPDSRSVDESFWPKGWWKLLDFRIGIIPLPVYVLLVILIIGFAISGSVPSEVSMFIAILPLGGFTCAVIGKAASDPAQRRGGGDLRDIHSISPCLLSFASRPFVGSILSMDKNSKANSRNQWIRYA